MFDNIALPPEVVSEIGEMIWFILVVCILPFVLHYLDEGASEDASGLHEPILLPAIWRNKIWSRPQVTQRWSGIASERKLRRARRPAAMP